MPALRAEELTKRYGDREALAGVSFTAAPGETVAIVGPNGAGKSTLLQLLAGALAPTSGRVHVDGGRVGWAPQQAAVYSKLSVAENLRLFARLERVRDVPATVSRMLEQTGLRERAGDEVGRLSGGNRQRVNIAVGLLADPAVLLLDEPSASLDPRQRDVLWEVVERLRTGGTTVLFTTHEIGEVERHAQRVLVLADGRLAFAGAPAELRGDAPDVETAFAELLGARGL